MLSGGDGSVAYPLWPLSADERATAEFDVDTNTVIDEATCLMWQRAVNPGSHDFQSAVSVCENLGVGGFTDWRLPTRAELVSLTSYDLSPLAINQAAFDVPSDEFYWSATVGADDNSLAWAVRTGSGNLNLLDQTNSRAVRCVRGTGAPSNSRFSIEGTASVRDVHTGLVWEMSPATTAFASLADATQHCAALDMDGRSSWRVPTVRELILVLDPSVADPALPSPFASVNNGFNWTTTPVVFASGRNWLVHDEDGAAVFQSTPPAVVRARCVHDG